MNEDFFTTDTPPVLDAFSTPSMWYRANGIAAGAKRQRNVADYIPQLMRGVSPDAIAGAEKEDAQAKKAMELAQGFAGELDTLDPKQLDEILKSDPGAATGRVEDRKPPTYKEPKMRGPGTVELLLSALGAAGNPRFAPQILAAPFEAEINAYGMRKQDADKQYERETDAYNRQNDLDMKLQTLTANMDAKEAALVQRMAIAEMQNNVKLLMEQGRNERDAQHLAMQMMGQQLTLAIAKMKDTTTQRGQDMTFDLGNRKIDLAEKQFLSLDEYRKVLAEVAKGNLALNTQDKQHKWAEATARLMQSAQRIQIYGRIADSVTRNAATNEFRASWDGYQNALKGIGLKLDIEGAMSLLPPMFRDMVTQGIGQLPQAPPSAPGGTPLPSGSITPQGTRPSGPTGTMNNNVKPKPKPKQSGKPPPGFAFDRP